MSWKRRNFLIFASLGTTAGIFASTSSCSNQSSAINQEVEDSSSNFASPVEETNSLTGKPSSDEWQDIRNDFNLDPNYIHLAGLLLTSHPAPVHQAIEEYQRELNSNPAFYVQDNNYQLQAQVRQAAANYLKTQPNEIALTDSTTMGTALIINGIKIRQDQEMLTSEFDYYSTHQSLRYKAERSGASYREISSYQNIQTVSEEEIVNTLIKSVRPETRLVTATWVHSSTGLKVPIRLIADQLEEINANRDQSDRILFLVDGVHGLGVEDASMADLNCDFFTAGTHKWLFAPRGTGIIWGNPRSLSEVSPTIPTFTQDGGWGGQMTPGGFKPFEHLWAMTEAFNFHQQIGKSRITERIHSLSQHLKEELAQMSHVTLYTPISDNLSAGIVCFDLDGFSPRQVVQQLRKNNIVASTTPYNPSHARLTPGIYNTHSEVETTLKIIHELA
ncbi:aminotransferase class V [Gloeothece citriformis PCC 7424]|uniref:Aminotransferase class V n=1 Tax=Gloeothece citriformis (strain PCC 7424) TaxID=65393 RepID=B7KKG4_GLOC7|nr:aminotransferase class V-fold PLP-dependent enzyme [Gloeothece citriformis]ACK72297.1 aminotransferase class V [Gloeothece citriformis PCC 7424]